MIAKNARFCRKWVIYGPKCRLMWLLKASQCQALTATDFIFSSSGYSAKRWVHLIASALNSSNPMTDLMASLTEQTLLCLTASSSLMSDWNDLICRHSIIIFFQKRYYLIVDCSSRWLKCRLFWQEPHFLRVIARLSRVNPAYYCHSSDHTTHIPLAS